MMTTMITTSQITTHQTDSALNLPDRDQQGSTHPPTLGEMGNDYYSRFMH